MKNSAAGTKRTVLHLVATDQLQSERYTKNLQIPAVGSLNGRLVSLGSRSIDVSGLPILLNSLGYVAGAPKIVQKTSILQGVGC